METKGNTNRNVISGINGILTALALVLVVAVTAACGGGGASAALPTGGGNLDQPADTYQPNPGTADLAGTLVQGSEDRVTSAAGDSLAGVIVTLINTLTGDLAGVDVTDSLGKFEFKGVPSGDTYLIKVEFTSAEDLDGDGNPDEIELYVPVSLSDQAVVELLQQIGVSDSDGDGTLDAVEVEFSLSDDSGNVSQHHSQHRRRSGETVEDSDNDGSFDDETAVDDSDADGLPDSSMSDDSSTGDDSSGNGNDDSSLHELEVKGLIEAIDDTSITVGGVVFSLTEFTTWRIDDNRNADPALFLVGMYVEVEGLPDGQGGWNATKVKSEDMENSTGDDNDGEDDNSDDSGDDSGDDDGGDSGDDDGDDSGDDNGDDSGDDDGDDNGDDSGDDNGDDDGDDSGDDDGDDSGDDDGDDSGDDNGDDNGDDDGGDDGDGDGEDDGDGN